MFNYQCDENYQKINAVSQNYPQLTTFEKEWLFFDRYAYMPGVPVELEYQTVQTNDMASVLNAIPYQYKQASLNGDTKYRDINTGDILDTFDETKNLELVSVKRPSLKTIKKNLYHFGDVNFTSTKTSWHDAKGTANMYGNIGSKSKCRFMLKKGTYTFSIGSMSNFVNPQLVTDNEVVVNNHNNTFTINEDTFLTLRGIVEVANEPSILTQIQIEGGATQTPYEPFKSNVLTVNDDVELHGIDDVRDEVDLLTGELTERIGEVVFDGSEDWEIDGDTNDYRLALSLKHNGKMLKYKPIICDKYVGKSGKQSETICNYVYIGGSSINVYVNPSMTLEEFKSELNQNPMTLLYQLPTESVKKTVDLTYLLTKPVEGANHYQVSSDTINPMFIAEVPVVSEGAQTLAEINQTTYLNL